MSRLKTFIKLSSRLVAKTPEFISTKYERSSRSRKAVSFLLFILKTLGKLLLGCLMVVVHVIAFWAEANKNEMDDEDEFIKDHDNQKGGVKVGNNHYSEDQASSHFQNGKFYDKY